MRVALFATCLADQLFPEVAVASVRLLRHLGVDVDFPDRQTCCGQPAYNAGYHREASEIAVHHLEVFEGYDYVVLPSGSCGAMVKTHYPELLSEASKHYGRARDLAQRTFELTTFITEVLGRTEIGSNLRGLKVTYHDSCHALRFMRVSQAPRTLLKVAGAELIEAPDHDVCCGFGGLFSVKMPEISAAMARGKLEGIGASRASVLTSTDAGCLMQLQGSMHRAGLEIPVKHVSELLWQGIAGV
ncbi:MAG: (Fe-S)-binding protein [Trueperaceae bacterium]|nr:MAG: (Fe-S)-binding protein [Trueperaceae bacterium]